jgi:two-component system CheB/CheR fusion protein
MSEETVNGAAAAAPAPAPAGSPPERPTPIVGIGASAGGIAALNRMFPRFAAESGLSLVLVMHLDPEHPSLLTEMLARVSPMPVRLIEDDMAVETNTVYVIPPNVNLAIRERRLRLSPPTSPRGYRTPIDIFFTALAEDQGENAACVILSGTGSDGTLGLRAINEHGGLTLAQAGAEYDGMMRSALATGLVDYVLPVEEIPGKLAEYFRHLDHVGARKGPDGVRQEAADDLAQVTALLRARTGHDFSDYKDKTLVRRVQRRMQVLQIEDVPQFIARLQQEPKELDLLFQELLIGVTGFFRDKAAFAALEQQVIPRLFLGKGVSDTVRVWVAGCSTGEEAYSVAMLLREAAATMTSAPKLQVFATDIDEPALAIARVGRYPATIVKDLSEERLARHFVREDGSYRVSGDLREQCLFSMHNPLRDAPFSRLDLISYRNLLIYLNADLQNRVIPLFHYALRDGGYLFLGSSEGLGRQTRLFTVVDKASRVFQRRSQIERKLPEFPLTAPDGAKRLGHYAPRAVPELSVQSAAEQRLLESFAPAYVVINAEGEILHASARTGKYLELPAGLPDHNIFSLARRGLRLDLRAALHRAASTRRPVTQANLVVGTNGGRQVIDLVVQPLRPDTTEDSPFLVVFRDIGGVVPEHDHGTGAAVEDVKEANVRQLEQELRSTRERLQTTTEELESANEELKSSNEELSSMNEELQSANEELETSREELQSINEELQTVNAELNARVDELSRANSDIANLLESTQIATLFMDRKLTVKAFTPAARDIFRLVESDTGRPIGHVRARFEPETVEEDAERVLRTLGTIERQVRSTDTDARYMMRMLPYRTVDNVINGVVLTFTDITRISAAEARVSQLTRDLGDRAGSLETLLDLVPVGILILDTRDGRQVRRNRCAAQMMQAGDEQPGTDATAAGPRLRVNDTEIAEQDQPLGLAARTGEPVHGFEAQLVRPDGSTLAVLISATPLFDDEKQIRGAIAALVDIGDRKQAEHHQQLLLHELQHRVKNILATVTALASRMLRDAPSTQAFAEGFIARLLAMGRMHDLLSRENWQGADLRELISATLAPYLGERDAVRLAGPAVILKPSQSSTLGMVLHELGTNAGKYGALSVPQGHVEIAWHLESEAPRKAIVITWSEHGGPPAAPGDSEGFGLSFVRRSVEFELDGEFSADFSADGLNCRIIFPLERQAIQQS